MTRDDILRMAREAGFRAGHIELYGSEPMPFIAPCSATDCLPELERFAALVAATERTARARHFDVAMRNAVTAEREACAKGCETSVAGFGSETEWADGYIQAAKDIAEGIRARGDAY